jgi:hypothetical protein
LVGVTAGARAAAAEGRLTPRIFSSSWAARVASGNSASTFAACRSFIFARILTAVFSWPESAICYRIRAAASGAMLLYISPILSMFLSSPLSMSSWFFF